MKPLTALKGVDRLNFRTHTKAGDALYEEFGQVMHGWRGLFDVGSFEWDQTTREQKAAMLDRLLAFFGCEFDVLVYLWAKSNLSADRLYRLEGLQHAVYEIAHHSKAAEHYLLRCKHPLFKAGTERLTRRNWKEALRAYIVAAGQLPWLVNKANVAGLLLRPPETYL
jgi:hypothetical protein